MIRTHFRLLSMCFQLFSLWSKIGHHPSVQQKPSKSSTHPNMSTCQHGMVVNHLQEIPMLAFSRRMFAPKVQQGFIYTSQVVQDFFHQQYNMIQHHQRKTKQIHASNTTYHASDELQDRLLWVVCSTNSNCTCFSKTWFLYNKYQIRLIFLYLVLIQSMKLGSQKQRLEMADWHGT